MRIALGCMRLSTEADRDEARGLAVLAAALDVGVGVFDTARAYATGEEDRGHNERLIARAWSARPAPPRARIVTKCGMRRDGGAWIPDGRAKSIAEDASASAEALGAVPIDVLLLHAPDPRVPLATTARALAEARDRGLARRVGVSNVSRKQLEDIVEHAPIEAVEIPSAPTTIWRFAMVWWRIASSGTSRYWRTRHSAVPRARRGSRAIRCSRASQRGTSRPERSTFSWPTFSRFIPR